MGSNGFYEINTVLNLCSGTQFVKYICIFFFKRSFSLVVYILLEGV